MIPPLAAAQAQTFLTAPVNLSNTGQATIPAIAVGPAGDINVVWLDSGAILFRRSVDGGQTFSAPMTVATGNLPPQGSQPQIAVNSAGVYVAWAGPSDVFFSNLASGASAWLSPPVNVSRGKGIASGTTAVPRITVDPNGGVDIVWGASGAFFARSNNGGNSFSTITQLSGSPMASVSPRIAGSGQGIVYAVWENAGSCPTITFARSTDNGATFTAYSVDDTLTVNGVQQTGCAYDVQVAVGASNTVHLLWANDHSTLTTIKDLITTYQTDSGGGSFQGFDSTHHLGFQNLSSTASYTPQMAIDGSGAIDVVWMGEASQSDSRQVVYFTRSTNGGNSYANPATLTTPPAAGARPTGFPQIAAELSGAIDLIWQQASATNPANAFDIILARSTDGVNFARTTLNNVPTTQGGTGQNAVDASGNVYAVWQGSSGGGGDVLLNGDSAGLIASVQFSLNGVKVSAAPGSAVINVGGSGSFALTASSANSVPGSFTLSCGGAPAGVNCSFSPNPVNLTANGNASVTLSVSVSAKPTGSMAEPIPSESARLRLDRLPALLIGLLGIELAVFLLGCIADKKKKASRLIRPLAFAALLAAAATGMMSCGGGTTGGGGGGSITFPLTLLAHSNSGTASMGTISITVP